MHPAEANGDHPTLNVEADDVIFASGDFTKNDTYTLKFQNVPAGVKAIRIERYGGKVLITLEGETKPGLHRLVWDLRPKAEEGKPAPALVKPGDYPYVKETINTVELNDQVIVCRADVPAEVIYEITKAIDERKKGMTDAAGGQVDPIENQWETKVTPLHPGAERYYREAGYIK